MTTTTTTKGIIEGLLAGTYTENQLRGWIASADASAVDSFRADLNGQKLATLRSVARALDSLDASFINFAKKSQIVDAIVTGSYEAVEKVGFDRDEVSKMIEAALAKHVGTGSAIDPEALRGLVSSEVEKLVGDGTRRRVIEIRIPERGTKFEGEFVHPELADVLAEVAASDDEVPLVPALVGPAGSGKTTGAKMVAKALGLPFFPFSICKQTSKSDLVGFTSANGDIVRTAFRDAFENGGVFLFDEMDSGNAGILTLINSAIANRVCSFPDAVLKAHKNFLPIVAMNTFGTGANMLYVGRDPLDASTRDRFVFHVWDYDETLEAALAEKQGVPKSWVEFVQSARKACDDLKVKHIISPRATMKGGRLLALGQSLQKVKARVVFMGLDADTIRKIENRMVMNKQSEAAA